MAASLSATLVKTDDADNVRLVKKGTNKEGRDDVSSALVLCSGLFDRSRHRPRSRWRYRGVA